MSDIFAAGLSFGKCRAKFLSAVKRIGRLACALELSVWMLIAPILDAAHCKMTAVLLAGLAIAITYFAIVFAMSVRVKNYGFLDAAFNPV